MKAFRIWMGVIAIGGVALVGTACGTEKGPPARGSDAPPPPATSTPTPNPDPTATPEPTQAPMKIVPAPIESVEIDVLESLPVQYKVRIVSGLPNGCHRFDDISVEREGNTFRVKVTNTKPSDPGVVCTQVYGTAENSVKLEGEFQSGETYTALVNDTKKTFVAQ